MRIFGLLLTAIWVLPLTMMLAAALACLMSRAARRWFRFHVFGEGAPIDLVPTSASGLGEVGLVAPSLAVGTADAVAPNSSDLPDGRVGLTGREQPPQRPLIARFERPRKRYPVRDRETLRLRAENFRSMAYASKDKNVRSVLLEAASELDAQTNDRV
jgi:hypothetical protein